MPRQPRLEFPGAFYHVMARCNRKEHLFQKEETKILMLKSLGEAAIRYGWKVHAYAIMNNHYHIILETPQANLVSGMTWFQTAFTVRCNRQNDQCGHVFAGRYKSVLVQAKGGGYFHRLLTYIHLNPSRAGVFPQQDSDFLHAHRWTSLYWLTKKAQDRPSWYTAEQFIVPKSSGQKGVSEQNYLSQMEEQARREKKLSGTDNKADLETLDITLTRGWIYGDISFREQMRKHIKQTSHISIKTTSSEASVDWYMAHAQKAFGLKKEEILAKRKSAPEKIALGMILKENTGITHRALAEYLQMGHYVRSSTLINKALERKNDKSPESICYWKLIRMN